MSIYSSPAPHEANQQYLLAWLTDSAPQSAHQLAAYAQMSQPTVSRTLAALGNRIHRLGAARSTRYALKKRYSGLSATQALNWDGAQTSGSPQPFGRLTYLHDDPRKRSWTHPSVPLQAAVGRRDDDAHTRTRVRYEEQPPPAAAYRGAIGRVALSPQLVTVLAEKILMCNKDLAWK